MRAALRVLTVTTAVLCSVLAAQQPSPNSVSREAAIESLYITHVTIISTETGKEARNQTVLVSGGRISEVDDSSKVKVVEGARVVDGTGKYLIPGIWDMHVHTWDYESTYPLYVANGVTGVRDMFGPPDANKFRTELAHKTVVAPHFYLASPIIDGNPPRWANSIAVSTAEDARRAVDEQKNKGADFIKVYDVLSRESYFAIADESRRQKISFVGHVPILVTAREASDAGQKSDEHLRGIPLACSSREEELQSKMTLVMPASARNRLDLAAMRNHSEEKCQRLFSVFKKNGTWQVPTLTLKRSFARLDDEGFRRDDRLRFFREDYRAWLAPQDDSRLKTWTAADFATERELFAYAQKLVGAMFRAGVPILAGTDTGNPYCFPGFSLHDELALLVESGLTPLAALQAATLKAAVFMKATDRYGSIAKGKIADLVLLDADPLQDIHNTTRIQEVFLAGKEFNRTALDGILKTAEAEASASDQLPSSSPQSALEMQSFAKAFEGRWSITEKYEPDEWTPNGGVGYGEEVWRRGPSGFTFMEEIHDHTPNGEQFGVGFSWWDRAKGLQGLWCVNTNPQGCDLQSAVSGFGPKWDGKQLVVDTEFPRNGKKFVWHEVFSEITPTSFLQTADIGEKGGPLKRWLTIHATRVQEKPMEAITSDSAEAEIRAAMAERLKASLEGDSDKVASLLADEYLQTDISGHVQDKATWFKEYFNPIAELIRAGKFRWEVYGQNELQFRIYGDSAVVVGVLEAKGTGARWVPQSHTWEADPNASFSGTLRFTHVYVKRNGKWLLAALHNAVPFSPPPSK